MQQETPTNATRASATASTSQLTLDDAIRISDTTPSPEAVACLRRLAMVLQPAVDARLPARKLAAVLILLSCDLNGDLVVTLTTRSARLRTFPGETCLPGGKCDPGEADAWATALREANEEVGLPLDEPLIRLCELPTFVSATLLFVLPVVAFAPRSVTQRLKPSPAEVSAIWSIPLSSVLDPPQRSYQDVAWIEGRHWRLHSFDFGAASPLTGLTAEILLTTALLASGQQELSFERHAADQLSWSELVEAVLAGKGGGDRDERTKLRA